MMTKDQYIESLRKLNLNLYIGAEEKLLVCVNLSNT